MQSPSRSPVRLSSIGQIPQLSPTIPSATPAVLNGSSVTRESYETPSAKPITQTQSNNIVQSSVILPSTRSNVIVPSYQGRTAIIPRDSQQISPLSQSSPMISTPSSPMVSTPSSPMISTPSSAVVSTQSSPMVSTPSSAVRRLESLPKPSLSPRSGSSMGPIIQPSTTPQISNDANNIQFGTPQGMIENQDILKLLADRGYMPFRTTMVKGNNGNVPKYVKAINDRGNTVYVKIDMDGNVMTQPGDLTTIESKEATSVPLSVKIGAYNCAGLDVCAVALECDDGICMLMKDDDTNMKEVMLTKVEKRSEEGIVEGDSPIAYPVVRLSEILENPVMTSKIIDDATVKMRNAAVQNYLRKVDELEGSNKKNIVGSRNEANQSVEMFVKKIDNIMITLLTKLKNLEGKRNKYDAVPPKNDKEVEDLRKISLEIRNVNDKLINLLKLSKNIERYINIFDTITTDAKEFINFMNDAF